MNIFLKKFLLSSTSVFSCIVLNCTELHASSVMQQRVIRAAIGQNVTPATAAQMIKNKDQQEEFNKKVKGKVAADVYATKKKAGEKVEDIIIGK